MARRLNRLGSLCVVLVIASAFEARAVQAQPARPPRPQPLVRTPAQLEAELEPGSQIELVAGGERRVVRGEVVAVSPSSLVIITTAGPAEISMDDIHAIWRRRRAGLRRKALAGAFAGLALGIAARFGQGDCTDPESLCAKDGPVTAADIGGAVASGAATGSLFWLMKEKHLLFFPTALSRDVTRADEPKALSPPSPQWLALANMIEPGRELTVDQGRGLIWRGSLVQIGASSIELLVDGQRQTLQWDDVRRIWRGRPAEIAEAVGAGYLVGMFGGAAIAALSCGSDSFEPCFDRRGPAWIFGGGAVGAAIIAVSTIRENRRALVYESSPALSRSRAIVQPLLGRGVVGVRGTLSF